ncbi:tetratricopeptide repeat protein [Halioxenophilus sp. WMMB6]|uniref:tetratricopeptide repeat protein n=1 Tax=Halioxenophilus sp. WMMB6 TaxID=3073815 RepID=UPI00295EF33A|nr:tetratricopeptide repeat protein [Halioxenophilus sp. WMMB6]
MTTDLQGNSLTGASADSASAYQNALHKLNLYSADPLPDIDSALAQQPECASLHIIRGLILAIATEPAAMHDAQATLAGLQRLPVNDREQSLVEALAFMVTGHWRAAGHHLDRHSMRYPLDLLALQTGHLIDFYCANSRNLRERIARALPHWQASVAGYPVVLGMYAFGLEETGDYARAEDYGRQAVYLQPLDCWAHHAVAHVMEMQGRPEDGIGWMIAREPHWSAESNFFKVHNWWHRALFHLDLGQNDDALALYDRQIRAQPSPAVLDLIDASALLWRLQLAEVEVGGRWRELAECWLNHADGSTYPFNDWHAAMALLGAEQEEALQELITRLQQGAERAATGSWIKAIALPLVQGFADFQHGNYSEAIATLLPVRHFADQFGGSHAQRDIIDLTLLAAAKRGGDRVTLRALANERLALRPYSVMSRGFLAAVSALEQ